MRQHESMQQGSPEWHEFRKTHFGASEAAAMLGLSKQLSRNDLLLYKSTGKSREYSDWVQKNILDYGHEVEHSARLITESLMNTELFPVTCSMDKLSASCDGLTFDGEIVWEHKQWNNDLAEYVFENDTVPDSHMPQCQQLLMVTSAKKLIFTVSDGTDNKRVSCAIKPCKEWEKKLISGWAQFVRDLANYQHKEFAKKPKVTVTTKFPAIVVEAKGEVTVCNLPDITSYFDDWLTDAIVVLETDDDFALAEEQSKIARDQAKRCKKSARSVIDQMLCVSEIVATLEQYEKKFDAMALTQEKLVKSQKAAIKNKIIDAGFVLCEKHTDAIHDELVKHVSFGHLAKSVWSLSMLEQACKGLRTLASLHNAVDTEVAAIKIKLDDLACIVRKNLTHLPEDLSLFRDLQSIITKPEDDFKLLVESRLAEQKRKDEEAAQRAIAEVKAAEERGKAHMAAAATHADLRLQAKAEFEKKEAAALELNQKHKAKVIDEAVESLVQLGNVSSSDLVQAIIDGKIKHVSINF